VLRGRIAVRHRADYFRAARRCNPFRTVADLASLDGTKAPARCLNLPLRDGRGMR
jgi:hypothetical protein